MADSTIRTFLSSLGNLDMAKGLATNDARAVVVREHTDAQLPL